MIPCKDYWENIHIPSNLYSSAPGDYDSSRSPYAVTFQPGQPTQSISVQTINDNTVEMREFFTAVLSNTDESRDLGVNVIDPDEATVYIIDNDSRESALYSEVENATQCC